MNNKLFRKHKAFSLMELLVAILILGIMSTVITLNASSFGATAKKEAEKVAAIFRRHIDRADKIHGGFTANITTSQIQIGDKIYKASEGCSYSNNNNEYDYEYTFSSDHFVNISLESVQSDLDGYTYVLKIEDSKGNKHWVCLK